MNSSFRDAADHPILLPGMPLDSLVYIILVQCTASEDASSANPRFNDTGIAAVEITVCAGPAPCMQVHCCSGHAHKLPFPLYTGLQSRVLYTATPARLVSHAQIHCHVEFHLHHLQELG